MKNRLGLTLLVIILGVAVLLLIRQGGAAPPRPDAASATPDANGCEALDVFASGEAALNCPTPATPTAANIPTSVPAATATRRVRTPAPTVTRRVRTPRATATARVRTRPQTETPVTSEAAPLTVSATPAVTEAPLPSPAQTTAATGVAPPTTAPTVGPAVTPEAPATVVSIAANNQLVNPCFDGTHNGDPPGWQQTPGWDVSANKNPCGPNQSAGRINDPSQAGESGPDRDERIWQVVAGRGTYLVAEMRCVNHFAYYADMNVYGGDSSNGPWTLVWTPFTLADCAKDRWGEAVRHAETQLTGAEGYAFYKVEFAAMYAPVGPDSGGVKFTNAYFESR